MKSKPSTWVRRACKHHGVSEDEITEASKCLTKADILKEMTPKEAQILAAVPPQVLEKIYKYLGIQD